VCELCICIFTAIGPMIGLGIGLYGPIILKEILTEREKLTDAEATAKASIYKVCSV
jgi:hypothetical protein